MRIFYATNPSLAESASAVVLEWTDRRVVIGGNLADIAHGQKDGCDNSRTTPRARFPGAD